MATDGYGLLISRARDKKGLSQSRLAEKVFVNARTVSRWETERTRPSAESIKLLAMVLEIPLEVLETAVGASSPASSTADRLSPQAAGDSGAEAELAGTTHEPLAGQLGSQRLSRRWFRPALVVAGLIVVGAIAMLLLEPSNEGRGQDRETSAGFASPAVSAVPPGAVAKAVLGRDLEPDIGSPCGTQNEAGAGWVFGPANVGGVHYDAAYRCSISSGASGELIFSLDKKYSRLRIVTGFVSGSRSGSVEFSILRDGTLTPMTPFELEPGETSTLDYSVEGVSRLSIRLSAVGEFGGEEPTPALASLQLF